MINLKKILLNSAIFACFSVGAGVNAADVNAAADGLKDFITEVKSRKASTSWMTKEDHTDFDALFSPGGQVSMLGQDKQLAATKAWLINRQRESSIATAYEILGRSHGW